MPEMIIVLVIALVVFGPAKLPQLGQSLGAGIRNFKKATIEDDVTLVNKVEGEETK
jgi:sec-independent protein translocase protein TatA